MAIVRDLATIILTIVAVISMLAVLKYQVNRNEDEAHEERQRATDKIDALTKDMAVFIAEIKVLSNGQSIINKFTADAIQSLQNELDRLQYRVKDK